MDIGSIDSLHSMHDYPLPTPTPQEENATVTRKRLSYVLGFLYSIFLIILGTLIFTASNITYLWTIYDLCAPVFTLYVSASSFLILLLLTIDIKLFTRKIRKQVEKLRRREDEMELEHIRQVLLDSSVEDDGSVSRNTERDQYATRHLQHEVEHIEHNYCFAQGRHAGSVYLKFGAAAFALGHFVHTILLVVVIHVSIYMNNADCINIPEYVAALIESLYCFAQLFFVINYSNLIIIKYGTFARMAFLHIMAANICLWVKAVTTEIHLAYRAYEWAQFDKNTTSAEFDDPCMPTIRVFRIFDDYSAYLYPFTIEFNILTVGVFFSVWRHIAKCRRTKEEIQDFHHSLYATSNVSGEVNSPHVLDIRISCRNSMGGLFSSLFVIVILIVAIILGFVFGNMGSKTLEAIGYLTGHSANLFFHTIMFVITVVAFWKTRTLDINKHPVPWLDDVLLYICVPAFFLETLFTAIATISKLKIVQLLDTLIMSLQMVLQVMFIIDGLRRCSNSRRLRRTKPGRELVLLLLVCNVCMWVMYTFSYKPPEKKDIRYLFFGKKMWLALGHICTPLIMFFRFHSSVCIADIWAYAYKPGIEDH